MKFSKEDPIYYRNELAKLLAKAKENGVEYFRSSNDRQISFRSTTTKETVSCYIPTVKELSDITK